MKPADTNDLNVLAIQPRRTSPEVNILLVNSSLTYFSAVLSLTPLPGGYSASVPPVPFPNTEVKCGRVDGSATYVCVRVDHCRAPHPKTAEFKLCGFFISVF